MRCRWATREPLLSYHDLEWGTPLHDERRLFEFLVLEGAQAGLSWETILRKRDAYRKAFDRFDPKKVARYGARDVNRLLRDDRIVRNRVRASAGAPPRTHVQTTGGTGLGPLLDSSREQRRWNSEPDALTRQFEYPPRSTRSRRASRASRSNSSM